MHLVDEIIESATDGNQAVATVLRKCLVLAFELKNEKLKVWVEKELNGYSAEDAFPKYREVWLHSKGNFHGPGGAWIPSRPLPMGILDKKHQGYLNPAKFMNPIAAYDTGGASDEKHNAVINWPPDLIGRYQEKFIPGYALAQAWQEVPASVMVSIVESVRNRILRFALEIREELGLVSDIPSAIPPVKVDNAVTNYIFGGTNVIAGIAHSFSQIENIVVGKDDIDSLKMALKSLDIADYDIEEFKQTIENDGKPNTKNLGSRTAEWIKNIGTKLGNAGLKIGADVAQQAATRWLMQYWGL